MEPFKVVDIITGTTSYRDVGPFTKCCFPTLVSFSIRSGDQWIVTGDASGFLHHVIADPATGRCRNSCEPTRARLNGRVPGVPAGMDPIPDDDAAAFINPMFRFAVRGETAPQRDYQFRFTTTGAFNPLLIGLSPDTKTLIQPIGIAPIPATGELAVTDGLYSGLLVVTPASVALTRQYR